MATLRPKTPHAPGLKAAWLSAMPAFDFEFGERREAPAEFRLFRQGINATDKGEFLFDDEAATSVMSAYTDKGVPLMADYEHQSLQIPPIVAPASATEFVPQVRNGELWATGVKWTDAARSMLEAGEYRMFSPAFLHDAKTGRVLKLINFALTNNPATHHLEPLVAASVTATATGDTPMECTQCTALNAQLKSMEEKCSALTARLTALESSDKEKAEQMTAATALRSHVVAITGKATDAEAISVLTAQKEQAAEVVALREKVATAETAALKAEFGAYLDLLTAKGQDGKALPPASRVIVESMALSVGNGTLTRAGIDLAKSAVPAMLREVASSATAQPAAAASTDPEMSRRMGINEAEFQKWRTERAGK